jgi:hypothetical protein
MGCPTGEQILPHNLSIVKTNQHNMKNTPPHKYKMFSRLADTTSNIEAQTN